MYELGRQNWDRCVDELRGMRKKGGVGGGFMLT